MTCGKLNKGGCDNPYLSHYGPCLNLSNWDIPIAICRDWDSARNTKVYRVDLRGGKYSSGYGSEVFIYVGTDTTSPSWAFRHAADKPERVKYFLANSAAQVRKFISEYPSIWPDVKMIHNTAGRNRDRATWREIFGTYERFDKIEFINGVGWGDVPRRHITSEDLARGTARIPQVGDHVTFDFQNDTYTITPKESTMTATSRAEALRRQAEEILIEADRLDSRPNEPVPEEEGEIAVVSWNMQFTTGTRTYNYAAIRTSEGRWSTTGPRSPKDYSWEDLIEWIFRNSADGEDTEIWICTEFGLLG